MLQCGKELIRSSVYVVLPSVHCHNDRKRGFPWHLDRHYCTRPVFQNENKASMLAGG